MWVFLFCLPFVNYSILFISLAFLFHLFFLKKNHNHHVRYEICFYWNWGKMEWVTCK